MLRVVVCLAFIAVCYSQVPQPCQSPAQWEARRMRFDRTQKFTEFARHAQDETNKRSRSIEEIEQGTEKDYFDKLHLYNEKKEYTLNLRTKKCNVTALTRPWRHVGVPPGSKFLFEAEIGAPTIPNEHLTATTWEGNFDDGAKYFVTVTYPDCIPMSFDVFSNSTNEHFIERYYDLKPGISDPMVWIPPTECMGL